MKKGSVLLKDVLEKIKTETITVGEFINVLKHRSLALMILIFSLPHAIPIIEPPGLSTITGLPILILSLHLLFGKKTIWIPQKIAKQHLPRKFLTKVIKWSLPIIMWFEKFMYPRLLFMYNKIGEKVVGFFLVILALILMMPIPGGNFLPGISISLIALSMLELDGIFTILSMLFSIGSVYFMSNLIIFAVKGIIKFFTN